MTKIEEIEQKLNECQKELTEIQKEITELNELQIELKESKKEGKWKPKVGERYYFRDIGGATSSYNWTNSDVDKRIFEHTLTFPNYEECERYWYFMDTVKEKSYEFSKEELVDTDIEKWYIGLKHAGLCVDFVYGVGLFGATYFKTEEDAKYIIDNFKDELMEYWI